MVGLTFPPPLREAAKRRFIPFWDRVTFGDGCWLWRGAMCCGYGVLTRQGKPIKAHRYVWQQTKGPIPQGLCILHQCDTPLCVRPDHLFLGTNADNMADRDRKGRGASGNRNGSRLHPERVPFGEQHGNHKLTVENVLRIRADFSAGESKSSLSRRFHVSRPAITSIIRKETWAKA